MTLTAAAQSATWTYVDGDWYEGNVAILGPRSHAMWLGSSVFDGARWFEGVAPDLDAHSRRVNASAIALGLKPTMSAGADRRAHLGRPQEIRRQDGRLHPADVLGRAWRLHGRAGRSGLDALLPVPLRSADDRTGRLLDRPCRRSAARPRNDADQRQGRLPLSQQRPGDPGSQDARLRQCAGARHARQRRRNRIVEHLPGQGRPGLHAGAQRHLPVRHHAQPARCRCWPTMASRSSEKTLSVREFLEADEIFSTGNHSKVVPITRIEDRNLQPGPVAKKARELYWEWAHSTPVRPECSIERTRRIALGCPGRCATTYLSPA